MRTHDLSTPRPPGRGFGLSHDAWGRLVLIDDEGRRFVGVEPVRAFPISEPGSWISIVDVEGREVVSIASLDDLPASVRPVLEQELAMREFVPIIQRIVRVSGSTPPSEWSVETDRGPTRFTLDSEDDVRRLGAHRVLISDAKRLRYHVPDTRVLDPGSRRVLERYL